MGHFIRDFIARFQTPDPGLDWFRVTFDDTAIQLDVRPLGRPPWTDRVPWHTIHRIAFEATDFMASDDIYIFANDRPESRLIPMEARGGEELWFEILRRDLFPADLSIKAMCSPSGLFVWPEPR